MTYLITGEVVALLGLSIGIPQKISLRAACSAAIVTVLVWPIPVLMMALAFYRALSRR